MQVEQEVHFGLTHHRWIVLLAGFYEIETAFLNIITLCTRSENAVCQSENLHKIHVNAWLKVAI